MIIKISRIELNHVLFTCGLRGIEVDVYTDETNDSLCYVEIHADKNPTLLYYIGKEVMSRVIDEMTDLEFEKSILMNLENREQTLKFREDFLENFKGITFKDFS